MKRDAKRRKTRSLIRSARVSLEPLRQRYTYIWPSGDIRVVVFFTTTRDPVTSVCRARRTGRKSDVLSFAKKTNFEDQKSWSEKGPDGRSSPPSGLHLPPYGRTFSFLSSMFVFFTYAGALISPSDRNGPRRKG